MLGVSAPETPASAWRAQRAQSIISDGQNHGLALGVGMSEARSAALVPEKTIIVGWGVPHPQRWR